MLLPYIISNRSKWISCKLRVFALINRQRESEIEERKWVSRFVKRIYTMSNIIAMYLCSSNIRKMNDDDICRGYGKYGSEEIY